ncbi:hypothetical protein KO481_02170 [Nocardia sp. NEAU-G5]|uniref:ANTAR domain-containing protein n=1 Tax=Nocardia albiluteola TaxID=2842303 RepID=A0ABS6ATJ2_9NOCA|nr:hypothetical protein [Nocardia albiluteola]MBU3060329.1 hypothetical protein [Nocardia albiluteola]
MTAADGDRLPGSASVFAEVRAAEQVADLERKALAAKMVASHALDVADCAYLLAMLGLDLPESREPVSDSEWQC